MRLYYVKTIYQFFCSLADKSASSIEEPALIVMNEYVKQKIKNMQLFADFFHCKYLVYNTNLVTSKDTENMNVFCHDVLSYYDNLLSDIDYKLEDFKEIHVYASLRFSLYLCLKKVKFYLHEDGNGAASKTGFVQWRAGVDKVDKSKIAKMYGLSDGTSKYIINAYCNKESQTKDFNGKVVDYNVSKTMSLLSNEIRMNLISLFTKELIVFGENPNLILTQFYFSDKDIENDFAKRAHLYQNIANYYLHDTNIFLKPHPADNVDYNNYFNIKIIDKDMPSELLLYYDGLKFENCITLSSSSVEMLKNICQNVKRIGNNEHWIIEYYDLLEAAIKLYRENFSQLTFMHFGIYNADVNMMLERNGLPASRWYSSSVDSKFVVIGDRFWGSKTRSVYEMQLRKNDIIVFLNYKDWTSVADSYKYHLDLEVVSGEFKSKALLIFGSESNYIKALNQSYEIKLNVTNLSATIKQSLSDRVEELEKKLIDQLLEIESLKKEVNLLKVNKIPGGGVNFLFRKINNKCELISLKHVNAYKECLA